METQGQKRVLSFEEFVEAGQDSGTDQMGMGEMPKMMHDDQPMMGMPGGENLPMKLDKEPAQDNDMDVTMMDEPQSEPNEEPAVAGINQDETDVAESIGSLFSR
jgi:hypothetical protein